MSLFVDNESQTSSLLEKNVINKERGKARIF